jgi:hypothetical protein
LSKNRPVTLKLIDFCGVQLEEEFGKTTADERAPEVTFNQIVISSIIIRVNNSSFLQLLIAINGQM